MPFYSYACNSCKKTFKSFHSSEENETKCIICKSSEITKTIPTVRTVLKNNTKETAGDRIEKFIEESREVLKEQMADARKEMK